jgi:hypothetical protein
LKNLFFFLFLKTAPTEKLHKSWSACMVMVKKCYMQNTNRWQAMQCSIKYTKLTQWNPTNMSNDFKVCGSVHLQSLK